MTNADVGDRLTAYLEGRLPAYLEELTALSAIECPTSHKPGVDQAGAWVTDWATQRGWEVTTWPDASAGDTQAITLRGDAPEGPAAMLVAHLDTVYPVGTAASRPARPAGDRLIGPGTADNKSGLLSGLYALAALEDLGLLSSFGRVTLVCGGDEETDMRVSGVVLRELAPVMDLALVLEAGRENGDIVGARKGSGAFRIEVAGKAAHAGVEPHKGANAVVALARHIDALHELNGMRPGMTLNVGVVAGGTVSNVVPDHAEARIDVRVVAAADTEPVRRALQEVVATERLPGTRAALHGDFKLPPLARTPAIDAVARLASECANELGFDVTAAATGGGSYANVLAGLGLTVLDGLGPIGGLDHSPDEYIEVSSIVPRTALLALLLHRWAERWPGRAAVSPEGERPDPEAM